MQSTGAPNSAASLAVGFPSRSARRRPVIAVVGRRGKMGRALS
jgi:hypothetical protein